MLLSHSSVLYTCCTAVSLNVLSLTGCQPAPCVVLWIVVHTSAIIFLHFTLLPIILHPCLSHQLQSMFPQFPSFTVSLVTASSSNSFSTLAFPVASHSLKFLFVFPFQFSELHVLYTYSEITGIADDDASHCCLESYSDKMLNFFVITTSLARTIH